ncbi:MAG: RNA 2',3'-cyclic phosphodiesterase [Deltaproteobacteria bacterium]|nr:RNA 2',3'-cyclic phosphodiesterase [Deltaproteobacteria bacterium]
MKPLERVRAFVAVNLPAEAVTRVAELQRQLKPKAAGLGLRLGWISPANLHVTLKFLGEIPREVVPAISAALERCVAGIEPLPVTVQGVGAFPSPARPRVIWVGVQSPGGALEKLAARVEHALGELGFSPEARPFHAHLTIGRVREGGGDLTAGAPEAPVDQCALSELVLYQSVLSSRDAEYTPLFRLPLPQPPRAARERAERRAEESSRDGEEGSEDARDDDT